MSTNNILWNATEWLENNFEDRNGLPGYFIAGDYSYQNRQKGTDDFITTVTLAKSSNNDLFSRWANAVCDDEFSILLNRSVIQYWDSLLEYENNQNSIRSNNQVRFINSDSSSRQFNLPAKRKQTLNHAPQPSRPRVMISEVDGVFVPGLSSSVGSFISNLANNGRITDRKTKYFITLGINGILDMTDTTEGSQLSQLPEEALRGCRSKFLCVSTNVDTSTVETYENLLLLNEKNYSTFLEKSLERIKNSQIHDKYDIVGDVYQYVLKQHLYWPEIFTEKIRNFLSEQDYIIKFWSYLIETVFRTSGVFAHWGDTISSFSIENGSFARMDLRLLNLSQNNSLTEAIDLGNAEFAKKETESKYYKDLLKAVLSSKIHLNEIITSFPGMTPERVKNLNLPLCIVAGTQCYVYSLCLESRNLYVLKDVCSMSIPLSLKELKEGGIHKLLHSLFILKDLCLSTKDMIADKEDVLKTARIPVIEKNKTDKNTRTLDWCKEVWFPPNSNDDDD